MIGHRAKPCQTEQEKESGSMSFQEDQDVSLMAYDQYLRLLHWTPRLSDEEILQLLQQIARGKSERMKACPDSRVLAQAMGVEAQILHEALACEQPRQSRKSLEGLQREEKAEDRQSCAGVFEAWVEADEARRVRVEQAVQEALMGLSPREREVMRWR